MEKDKLIDILLKEREYHAAHPVDVSSKFLYTLGGTITTIIVGFIFKDEIAILKNIIENYFFCWAIIFIVVGYTLIMYAINEHTKIHKLQLNRLENSIEYLLDPKIKYDYSAFWKTFGEVKFEINSSEDNYVPLITKEPDTRREFRFHDRKIEIGVYLIILGCLTLIIILIDLIR